MGPARQREFAAGRACARRAMRELGAPEGPVLRGVRRAPPFPDGVVGSITHTSGFCAAAVAHSASFAGIGLDAERNEALSERAAARICAPGELAALRALPGRSPEHWAAVVFSAKETLYKAYFPVTGFFIGFRDAVDRAVSPSPTMRAGSRPGSCAATRPTRRAGDGSRAVMRAMALSITGLVVRSHSPEPGY